MTTRATFVLIITPPKADDRRTPKSIHKVINLIPNEDVAKGTTDPRVEFISQDHSSQFTNHEHITISECRLTIKH